MMTSNSPLRWSDEPGSTLDIAVKAVRAAAAIHTHYRSLFDPRRDEADRQRMSRAVEVEARAACMFAIATGEASGSSAVYAEDLFALLDESGKILEADNERREKGGAWRAPQHDSYWLVDALDGIAGYRRNLPFSTATVAFIENGMVEAGAIFAPTMNELFTVSRESGARLNGFPCRTSGRTSPSGAMICSGGDLFFMASRPDGLQLRNFGSHALSLAYVACGRTEAYASVPKTPLLLGPWDCAAGALLVELAGGECLGPAGATFNPWAGGLIAAASGVLATTLTHNLDWTR